MDVTDLFMTHRSFAFADLIRCTNVYLLQARHQLTFNYQAQLTEDSIRRPFTMAEYLPLTQVWRLQVGVLNTWLYNIAYHHTSVCHVDGCVSITRSAENSEGQST